jgi:thiamine biosynthesis lipoprotein
MPNRPSNRRDFLSGRAAARAIADTVNSISASTPQSNASAGSLQRQSAYLEEYSKPAMACQFQLLFNMHQYPQSGATVGEAFELIDGLEDQMTVYRDHSEISQLNRTAFNGPVKVEQRLFGLLQSALNVHRETGGAFDITAGQLSKLWGFEQRSAEIPDDQAIQTTLQTVGSHHITLDDDAETVSFATEGLKINLGGIGKGFAIDRTAGLLRIEGINDFAIHGGQSSVLCAGNNVTQNSVPSADTQTGWPIGLSHPVLPEIRLATFHLKDQALGTSGSGRQGFFHQGKRLGHIIDPRTGWPTDRFLSTTVISPSAALSDALATAFFVMTLEEIESYCRTHQDVAAVITLGDPTAGRGDVELVWFNLGDDDWQRA